MKRIAIILTILAAPAFAGDQKQGEFEFTTVLSGEAAFISNGGDRTFVTYEGSGVFDRISGQTPGVATSSVHCVGSYVIVDGGVMEGHRGVCENVQPNGDKHFTEYSITGVVGQPNEQTWSYVGGTGALEGVTGGGAGQGFPMPAPTEGKWSGISRGQGSFKLP